MIITAFNLDTEQLVKIIEGKIIQVDAYLASSTLHSKLKTKADKGEKFIVHHDVDNLPNSVTARGLLIEVKE